MPDIPNVATEPDEIDVTPEMIEAGYVEYLGERQNIELGKARYLEIAFAAIFRAMLRKSKRKLG